MNLFRQEAVEHHDRSDQADQTSLQVNPPWSGWLFWAVTGALTLLLLWSLFGHLPVTERGRGVLLPVEGPRHLVAQFAGRVSKIHVRSGQLVKAGDPILEIAAPSIEGPALVALREQEVTRQGLVSLTQNENRIFQRQRELAQAKVRDAREQIYSLNTSIEIQERRLAAMVKLYGEGLVSGNNVDEAREGIESTRRQQKAAQQGLAQAQQDAGSIEAQQLDHALSRKRDQVRVGSTAEGQMLARNQTVVCAVADGIVEGIHSIQGDSVQIGDELGYIMPSGKLGVVAFIPERHRAFLHEGGEGFVEVDQLPYGEFGSASARIQRISSGIATPREIKAALGAEAGNGESVIRVELELLDDRPARKAGVPLRAGMLSNVRFVVRRQRVIVRVLAPLRRWFD